MARGRPRKAQTDETQTETEEQGASPGAGHNAPEALTDDEQRALAYHHKRAYQAALARKKEADAAFKNVAKLAKSEGVPVDTIKLLIELDTDEGKDKIADQIAERFKGARWAGVEVGETPDLFNQPDRTPLVDKARAAGNVAALNGEFCEPPYEHASELGQAWIAGYQDGQATMVSMLKKRETAAPILDRAEKGEVENDAEGLTDAELSAVAPAPSPPTASDDDLEMPSYLRREKAPELAEA